MTVVVEVENVGKSYRSYTSEWQRFARWFGVKIGSPVEESWVLSGVTFQLKRGESIGITGKNGAGKSTLLKILANVLVPTSGSVKIDGKLSAILELGLGFNDDLTGVENVKFSLAQMGVSVNSDILHKVEEFADIGEYFYQPVRTYSSGMRARVSFALSSIIEPDILIADEVLAVGDIFFQQKCIERMKELKENGTSIIFVSHDMNSIHEICDKALVLNEHKQIFLGNTQEASEIYYALNNNNSTLMSAKLENDVESSKPDDGQTETQSLVQLRNILKKYIVSACFVDEKQNEVADLMELGQYYLKINCKNLSGYSDPHIGFRIQNYLGAVIYETNTYCQNFFPAKHIKNGEVILLVKILSLPLIEGEYTLSIGIEDGGYGEGSFKHLVAPTVMYSTFNVKRTQDTNAWSGLSNLNIGILAYE